jgi:DNA-binding Xre family transcriptional regulator
MNMNMICKLPQLMEEKGINQKQLANATGLSPTTISKLYRNQLDRFDRNTILKLCEFFKCKSIAELIEIQGFFKEKNND